MSKAKWTKYTTNEIKQFAKESKSNAEFISKMGYSRTGGNPVKVIEQILLVIPDLDLSHFAGQGWRKNEFDYTRFTEDNYIKNGGSLNALEHLRGHKCEYCGMEEWNNKPIPLEVHHIDGNHYNNDLSNLQLLCPNCHAQTKNWKGRNIGKKEHISDEKFVEALRSSTSIRQALISLGLTGAGANYDRAYELIKKYNIEM